MSKNPHLFAFVSFFFSFEEANEKRVSFLRRKGEKRIHAYLEMFYKRKKKTWILEQKLEKSGFEFSLFEYTFDVGVYPQAQVLQSKLSFPSFPSFSKFDFLEKYYSLFLTLEPPLIRHLEHLNTIFSFIHQILQCIIKKL